MWDSEQAACIGAVYPSPSAGVPPIESVSFLFQTVIGMPSPSRCMERSLARVNRSNISQLGHSLALNGMQTI